MTSISLISSQESESELTHLFASQSTMACHLLGVEDRCFPEGQALHLGEIILKPRRQDDAAIANAISRGEFVSGSCRPFRMSEGVARAIRCSACAKSNSGQHKEGRKDS